MVSNDLSNRAILVLVVLTVIISTLGTLTVLESVSKMNTDAAPTGDAAIQTGRVTFNIAEAPPTGKVTFLIESPGEDDGNLE